jgi:hypothetical protein
MIPGMSRATRDSWNTKPMGEPTERIGLDLHFTDAERDSIREGLVPDGMDDRWFVWVDDDDVVHIHRSWTGFELYEVPLERAGDGWAATEAIVNRDPEQGSQNARFDTVAIREVLAGLAAGRGV